MRRRRPVFLIVILAIISLAFLVRWASGRPEVGPPVTFCPGPDAYGYTCETEQALGYVDASQDAGLYLDDGGVTIALPFGFNLYGTTYDQVYASSNGNLQFNSHNSSFENACLDRGPAAGLGDMVAPYWDDLNLTFSGVLETELVGSAPERIFVIEWDEVPSYDNPDETVTFEVQLFERSHDIAFLYQEVRRSDGDQGSSATVGLQSERQGFALQYGCNQFLIQDGSTILFAHPAEQAGQEANPEDPLQESARPLADAKGDVTVLLEHLNRLGPASLPEARDRWLNGTPQRDSQWQWADLTGSGREDLVFLWRWPERDADRSQLVVMEEEADGPWRPIWITWPLARREEVGSLVLAKTGDVTGDGAADVILSLSSSGRLIVASIAGGEWNLYDVPGQCQGSLILRDVSGDGVLDIVRDGCADSGRWAVQWRGAGFDRVEH